MFHCYVRSRRVKRIGQNPHSYLLLAASGDAVASLLATRAVQHQLAELQVGRAPQWTGTAGGNHMDSCG